MTLENIISMTLFMTFVVDVILGTYSLTLNIKSRLNRVFASLCFCFALWGFIFAALNSSLTSEEALFWRRLPVFGWGVAYSLMVIMIPVVTMYGIIRKYGLLLPPQNNNKSRPEGIILTTLSRTRLFKYISVVMIVGSILNFYSRISTGDNCITGLVLSFMLVLMGAFIVRIPYLFKSIKSQENALGVFLGILLPLVMLTHSNGDYRNIIWPIPIFFMMLSVIFNNRHIFLGLGIISLLMQVILWLLIPDSWLLVDKRFYFYRLLFYAIGIGLTAIITQIYVQRLQENSKQDAFHKMIAQFSTDFVTIDRTNFDQKVTQLLKKSGAFTSTDRVYLSRFSPDQKKLFCTHEWVSDGVTALIGESENGGIAVRPWSSGQILKNEIVDIPSPDQLPVAAEAERQWLKVRKVRAQILVPIQRNHSVIGLIGFDQIRSSRALREIDPDWLRVLANLLADAIAKVETEHDINYLAYYDPLTGIPNRVLFYRRLEQAIDLARQTGKKLGVIFIDLDGFKEVNDTLGHDWGDQLLKRIGKRLTDCLGEADLVGRFGGDEFLIMVPQLSHHRELEKIAAQVMSIFHRPMLVAEQELYVSGSGGIAIYPKDGENVNTLIKNADLAMYAAKKSGKGQISYCSGDMKEAVHEKMMLTNRLHRALANQELFLHYQPQISAKTDEITGFEALLRWHHPERGLISPEVFIPLAEQSGLISSIGEWVLKTACAQNKAWQEQGFKPVRMAVNLSVEQFRSSNLERIIAGCLQATGLEPRYLELEITEGIAMKTAHYVIRQLDGLKKLGVAISIDDFGTAFSSMSRLKDLPVDRIKIDRQFIWGIGENPRDEAVIAVMIDLARELGLAVTAEGVETAAQLAFLRAEGCDEIQGFYFSKPVSAEAIQTGIYQDQSVHIKPTAGAKKLVDRVLS